MKGIEIFINEIDGDKISLAVDIDANEFMEPGFMEDEPMNPDSPRSFYSIERQLNEMPNEEVLERSLEYLKDKLNEDKPQDNTGDHIDYSKKEDQIGCGYCAHEKVCKFKSPKTNLAKTCRYWVHWQDDDTQRQRANDLVSEINSNFLNKLLLINPTKEKTIKRFASSATVYENNYPVKNQEYTHWVEYTDGTREYVSENTINRIWKRWLVSLNTSKFSKDGFNVFEFNNR